MSDKVDALVQSFRDHFSEGKAFPSIGAAHRHAELIWGVPIRPGTAETKQVDEAIELAIVQTARKLVEQSLSPEAAYQAIVDLYQRQQPPLTVRSSTSALNRAYSTPIPVAWMVSHLADVQPESSVYEPCGGNGALLIAANPTTAEVNELDPVRAQVLRSQGFKVTEQDATTYVPSKTHDVVLANPPFSTLNNADGTKKVFHLNVNGDQFSTTCIDHAIVLNSLKAMKPDGCAVLIIGGHISSNARRERFYRGGQSSKFFELLYRHYNVTEHVTLARRFYHKHGANSPIDILVIQGQGPSRKPLNVPPIYDSFEALGKLIRPSRTRPITNSTTMTIPSPKAAINGLRQGHTLTTTDGVLSIVTPDNGKTFVLRTPLKTKIGGGYFLDYDLLKATGGPFYSVKKEMVCTISASRLDAVVTALYNKHKPLVSDRPLEGLSRVQLPVSDVLTQPLSEATQSLKQLRDWYTSVEDVPLSQDLGGYALLNTARHLLDASGIQPDANGRRSLTGKLYQIQESPSGLSIHANDRGKVVTLKNGTLSTNVTQQDIARFSVIADRLGEIVQQRQQRQQSVVSPRLGLSAPR